ncbi:hypothetical protein VW35_10895 [Devosia soli]|uniref:histidine kinase n=2 Tax=Devosia soli TaxID=361041 RepID=A0A0F5L703_9HYPH|nr:hypothetical protein VW35_10895 [Devosia soli]
MIMAVPGWLRLVPLLANLSLALPSVRQTLGVDVVFDFEPIIHGIRLYAVYGGAGLFLRHVARVSVPFRSWADVQWFIAIAVVAASVATASGLALHQLAGNMTGGQALMLADAWWLGDALGAVMVPPMLIPALMALTRQHMERWRWPRPKVFVLQAAIIGLAALLGALGPSIGANLWYLVIPPALILALRGGFEEAAGAVLITGIVTPAVAMLFGDPNTVGALSAPLLIMAIAALLVGAATTERQEAAQRLEALVAQRTAELEKAYELQRHLVRSIGHDIRQPLEAINLTVAGLGKTPDAAVLEGALDRVRQLGTLASDLLSRILTYARLDTGDVQPEMAPVALGGILQRLHALYQPQAQRRGLALDWPETDLVIESDGDLLFQVLSNYLDNAIRLTPEGGSVSILIEAGDEKIEIIVTDQFAAGSDHDSSRGGLGLRIVAGAASLLGATIIDLPNRKGIGFPLHRKR